MPADNASPSCEPLPPPIAGGIQVASVWSGVATAIGTATTAAGTQLFAYYDADRYLTLAALDASATRICRKRLESRFGGWDAHNALVLAIGPEGTLHLVGNMHATPMVYAQGSASDIRTARLVPMTGADEAHATYPHFLHDVGGNLLFMYRDGGSGNGRWLLNRWQSGGWRRVGALFQDHDAQGRISAYPTPFVRGPDGRFHVAVVWRRTNDVASNFALSYASTANFFDWQTGGGAVVQGPLSPETMATVDRPGENAGLVNNASIALDATGKPIILYTKYGQGGENAIFAARMEGRGWSSRPIAVAPVRVEMAGRGSIPDLPGATFAGPSVGNQQHVRIELPKAGVHDRLLDLNSLALTNTSGALPHRGDDAVAAALMARTSGMEDIELQGTTSHLNGIDPRATGHLRWFAQKPNGDRARACTPAAPRACAPPPSPLLWFPAG